MQIKLEWGILSVLPERPLPESTRNAAGGMERKEPMLLARWQLRDAMESVMEVSYKTKLELPYDPANLHLDETHIRKEESVIGCGARVQWILFTHPNDESMPLEQHGEA